MHEIGKQKMNEVIECVYEQMEEDELKEKLNCIVKVGKESFVKNMGMICGLIILKMKAKDVLMNKHELP